MRVGGWAAKHSGVGRESSVEGSPTAADMVAAADRVVGAGSSSSSSTGGEAVRRKARGGEGRIVIHVYDEGRGVQRDFSTNLQQLLSSMRYFQVCVCVCAPSCASPQTAVIVRLG